MLAGMAADPHVLLVQLVLGQAVPRALQYLKASGRVGWLGEETVIRNRIMAFGGALLAVGFAFTADGTMETGLKVALTIPPINDLPMFGMSIYTQYLMQKGIYHGMKQRAEAQLPPPQEPPKS